MTQVERTVLMARQRNATASAILRTLLLEGPLGRKELAGATGTSFTTITKAVAELVDLGALVEAAPSVSRRSAGRPAVPLDLRGPERVLVGAHLHPERTTCGAFTMRGDQVEYRVVPATGRTSAARVAEATALVLDVVGEVGADAVAGIGVATPWAEGPLGHLTRIAADVDHAAIRESLAQQLPHPVRVDSNVRALAVEQHWWGGFSGDVLTVLVGRSLGVAQVRGDELVWDGPTTGGVVSHLVVPGSDQPCVCGQTGCVTVSCTDDALLQRAVAAGLLPADASQHDLYGPDAPGSDGLARLRRERTVALGYLVPLVMSLVDPDETVMRGPLGSPEEVEACLDGIRDRYRTLVGRQAQVRYEYFRGLDGWARASAALALDRYLLAPLEHEVARAAQAPDASAAAAPRG